MNGLLFDKDGRLRSGWRATVFLLTFVFLSFFFIFGAMAVLAQLPIGPSAGSYLPLIIPFSISAAIANAVFHATGKRVRELSITPEKLLRADIHPDGDVCKGG